MPAPSALHWTPCECLVLKQTAQSQVRRETSRIRTRRRVGDRSALPWQTGRFLAMAQCLTPAAAVATMVRSSAREQGEAHHAISAPVSHDGDTDVLCRIGFPAAWPSAGAAHAASSGGCSIRHNPHWQLDHSCRCSVPRLRPLPLRAEEVADRGARSGARAGFLSFPELRKMEARGKQSGGFPPWRC
jgi:hypothetical protein